ncbi:carboxypeptidase S [Pholiota conissans]|uniref:Carboxypeptidase S n=1 Tax=Pholiota conissans TaxID=109636 RepID=A0A9P5ZEG4_9AGAR|nr:carboxypeptidase S [Pholiota conissans]
MANNEKSGPLLPSATTPASLAPAPHPGLRKKHPKIFAGLMVYILFRLGYEAHRSFYEHHDHAGATGAQACVQADVLAPVEHAPLWDTLNAKIGTSSFESSAVNWLAGAVRVPTESYDNMDSVGVDPRWEAFGPFHEYLLGAFPLVHSTLKLTKVNTYGLFYEWKGTDDSLKPLLLAAHQDVVPVDPTTVDQWTHPPYSGFFDGKRVWGRGSSDDKSGLIGILSAVETLIGAKFQPTRTIVLSFGFDEESSGYHGAGTLATHLESVYGTDSFALIVDEGSGFSEEYGSIVATPGIAEKGFLNVLVEVTAAGGHSSIPPAHTSIGILSALLVHYEQHPYHVTITRDEPIYETLQCIAQHAKNVPDKLRKTIKRSAKSKKALERLQETIRSDKVLSSLVGTTQAITLIQGGVKSNALPEQASAVVNHRIAVVSSLDEVKAHDTALLKHLGDKFNLTYSAFGTRISEEGAPSSGTLTLSDAFSGGLEPAPVTPTGRDAAPYQLLSGTIKATYNAHRSLKEADSVIVAPSMMSGNTDTRFYWNLSSHIFRYNHQNAGSSENPLGGIHTVNEFANVDSFLEQIRFFTTLILNVDETKAF